MGQTVLYFLIWALFIFAMMRLGCGMHVMGHGHGHDREPTGNPRWSPPEKDTDPVCGMTVESKAAKSSVHDGHVYYFCSQDCRQKFEDSPIAYLARAGSTQAMEGGHEYRR